MPASFINGPIPAVDFESITVSTISIGGTTSKLVVQTARGPAVEGQQYIDTQRVDEAFFTVETNPIRVRFDGTAPTASVGHLFQPGDTFTVTGYGNVAKVAMIRSGGADATVRVTYFRKS
jgi:hypothetical protein